MVILQVPCVAIAWVTVLFLLVQTSFAVQQDEAFNIDFAHTLFGSPIRHSTFFHRPDTASKATLLYTLGDKGVLGAVNPRDGGLVWRALVNDTAPSREERGHGVLRVQESSTTVVSGFGSSVRAWDAKDGRLVWEWVADAAKIKDLQLLKTGPAQSDVIVLVEAGHGASGLLRLSGIDGSVQWTQALAIGKGDMPLALSVSSAGTFATFLSPVNHGGYKIVVRRINTQSGKEEAHYTLNSENDVTSEASVVHVSGTSTAPVIVWTDDSMKNAHINVLGSKEVTMAMINPYGTDTLTGISVSESSSNDAAPHFLIQYDRESGHRAEVYHVDTTAGKAKKAFDVAKVGGNGTFSVGTTAAEVFFVRHTTNDSTLFSSTSPDPLKQWPLVKSPVAGSLQYSASELVVKPDGDYSVRTSVLASDGDWYMYQNGNHAWTRNEGLSGIVKAVFVEIPPENSIVEALAVESHSNIVSAYFQRVQRHMKDLRYFPAWLQAVPARFVSSLTGLDVGESFSSVAHDDFGFQKIIVVATEKGRIAAMGSANRGQVLWSVQIPLGVGVQFWDVIQFDLQGSRLFVFGAGGQYVILHSITGQLLQHIPSLPGVSHFVPIGDVDVKRSLLAVNPEGVPGPLPKGHGNEMRVVTQRTDGSVAGWKLTDDGRSELTWTFAPRPEEAVISISTRPAHDPVASIGRARGDRNVLYKFLSPSLALVTASSIALSTLSVYLLDTISGQLLYTTTHQGVDTATPVAATMSENWFAYTVFTDTPRDSAVEAKSTVKAHQLIVSELFESPFPNDRGPLGSALNYSSLTDKYTPHVQSVAFVIPAPVTAMATTSTLQGITPRSLLAYTPTLAGLIALPVPFLSPRRPVGRDPTQSEREEGLMPHQVHLDFAATWFLSHRRELLGVNGIIASPSHMESTSLIFAYGDIDCFGTRQSPIGTFDVLGKGFSKLQLLATVFAFAVGTGILAPMAKRKSIDMLWKN